MTPATQQRGAVLFVSLIVLLAVSVIAVTAARNARLEMLSAYSAEVSTYAFLRAEAGAVAGEADIRTNHPLGGPAFDFSASNTDPYYIKNTVNPNTMNWSGFAYRSVVDGTGTETARYVIEYLGATASAGGSMASGVGAPERHLYRVTALGLADRGSVRLVSTIFATN